MGFLSSSSSSSSASGAASMPTTPAQAALLQSVVDSALDQIKLEPELEDKLIRFRDFINTLSTGLAGTPFAHLMTADARQIFVFMLLLYGVVTKNGQQAVTQELINRSIRDTCLDYAKKDPIELMSAEQMAKLERYIMYFATIIAAKLATK